MNPELKDRLAKVGPIQVIDRVSSGSPEDLVLRPADGIAKVKVIVAVEALVRPGMTMRAAKTAIDGMVEAGEAVAHVPTVENAATLARDLRKHGIEGASHLDGAGGREGDPRRARIVASAVRAPFRPRRGRSAELGAGPHATGPPSASAASCHCCIAAGSRRGARGRDGVSFNPRG